MGEYRLQPGLPRSTRNQLVVMASLAAVACPAAALLDRAFGISAALCAAGIGSGCVIFLVAAAWEFRGRRGWILSVDSTGITRRSERGPERRLASYQIAFVQGGDNNRGLIVRAGGDLKPIHIPPGITDFPALYAELTNCGLKPKPSIRSQNWALVGVAAWIPILIRDFDVTPRILLSIDLALFALLIAAAVRQWRQRSKNLDTWGAAAVLLFWVAIDIGTPSWFPAAAGTLFLTLLTYFSLRGCFRWFRNPTRPRRGAELAGPCVGLCFCALLACLLHRDWGDVIHTEGIVGRQAPELRLVTTTGRRVALADSRGRPLVVGLWASWCGPCRQEAPLWNAWYSEQRRQGAAFDFLAVNDGEDAPTVQSYLAHDPVPYPVALDPNQSARAAFNIESIPSVFVIDPSGKIVFATTGFSAAIGRELTAALRR